MKAYEVEVRIRNNRLKQHRLKFGFSNQGALSEAVGLSAGLISHYEAMYTSPVGSRGEWKPSALKLAEFFGVGPDWLFPPETHAPNATSMVKRLDAAEIQPMLMGEHSGQLESPEEMVIRHEQFQGVQDAVAELPHQKRVALELRFGLGGQGPHTLDQIGHHFGRSRERAAQIIRGALRDLDTTELARLLGESKRCRLCHKDIKRRQHEDYGGFCSNCYSIRRRRRTTEGNTTHDDQERRDNT
jgi:transcriptional regulator with XRE-family HTH domain